MKTKLSTPAKMKLEKNFFKEMCCILMLFYGMAFGQIVNIPDANFKAVLLSASASNSIATNLSSLNFKIDANNDGEIQLSEALQVKSLSIPGSNISNLIGIQSFSNLDFFGSSHNIISNFDLNGLTNLKTISISYNTDSNTIFNFANLPSLQYFSFTYSNVSSLSLSFLNNLSTINAWGNSSLTTLNLVDLPMLNRIDANSCVISNFSCTNSPLLQYLSLNNSHLNTITVNNFPLLKTLNLASNNIVDVSGFTNLNNLETLNLAHNHIVNFNLPPLNALKYLSAGENGFATINLLGFPNLLNLSLNNNLLTALDFSNNHFIEQLILESNLLTYLDFSFLPNLKVISCSSNMFTELDFSYNPLIISIDYYNNPNLQHINLKSGTANTINYASSNYYNLGSLQYICIDDNDTFTYSFLSNPPSVSLTSYCSFIPGGNYNTITGSIIYDGDNNGCDPLDTPQPNIRINMTDGINVGGTFTNNMGNYTFFTQSGSFSLVPDIENQTWFTFSPPTATVSFADNNNHSTVQSFCIAPNGVHNDVEVVLAPVLPARPGFDATYKIVYKNKGNQTLSGGVSFTYDDSVLDFVYATVAPSSQSTGVLNWSYTNLMPFENRSFYITLHVNAPTDLPAVNIGNVLNFNTTVTPVITDENPLDNAFVYHQTVVGSFDPNNIICLEGDVVPTSQIGNYLHYVVNFENSGTAQAENIVAKVVVDASKYDVNSLQVLNTSNPAYSKITGNVVEFIFQNIALDSGGHGNVLFKIKTLNSLVNGNMVSKKAAIFFDYNQPINTGMANTTFQNLSNEQFAVDNSIMLYPNPVNSIITLKADSAIKSIQLYDVQGRLLETKLLDDAKATINISDKTNGIYFLKITSDNGSKVEKIVKE